MIPVFQTQSHNPSEGIYGDCHRAAVASILELPIDKVPHFFENDSVNDDKFDSNIRPWFASKGMSYLTFCYEAFELPNGEMFTHKNLLEAMTAWNPNIYYILGGKSPTGAGHSVVCLNDKIVHDPGNFSTTPIVGPMEDNVYWIDIIGVGELLKI